MAPGYIGCTRERQSSFWTGRIPSKRRSRSPVIPTIQIGFSAARITCAGSPLAARRPLLKRGINVESAGQRGRAILICFRIPTDPISFFDYLATWKAMAIQSVDGHYTLITTSIRGYIGIYPYYSTRSHRAAAPWPYERTFFWSRSFRRIIRIQSRPTPGQRRSRSPTLKLPG